MTAQQALAHPQVVKLTIEDFLLLDRSGAFANYARTELVDGVIIALSPQYRPHGYAKAELAYRLRRALESLGSTLYVGTEQSVAIPPASIPLPDIILTNAPRGDGPIPVNSVALLVEVADTTAAFDRGAKARAYAAGGVPEYWVVDLGERAVHQMWEAGTGSYANERSVSLGEQVAAVTIAGLAVETDEI